jgi:hypothetical protein
MPAPKKSKRPTPRPSAPRTSPRPRARPAEVEQRAADAGAVARGNNAARREAQDYQDFVVNKKRGGKVMKKASGGMCRGMGAATKGGKYMKNG